MHRACLLTPGFPVDTNGVSDMFLAAPYNYTAVATYCAARWGVVPDPRGLSQRMNITAATASRIIFSNGLIDPWYVGGILADLSPTLLAVLVPEAAHHMDLRGSAPQDPPAVTAARAREDAIITGWLAE